MYPVKGPVCLGIIFKLRLKIVPVLLNKIIKSVHQDKMFRNSIMVIYINILSKKSP